MTGVSSLREGWPRGFVLAQVPNAPLWVAMAAWAVRALTSGRVDAYASAVFYVALAIWAHGEATDGVNWFRRLLGVVFLTYVVVKLARTLHGA